MSIKVILLESFKNAIGLQIITLQRELFTMMRMLMKHIYDMCTYYPCYNVVYYNPVLASTGWDGGRGEFLFKVIIYNNSDRCNSYTILYL